MERRIRKFLEEVTLALDQSLVISNPVMVGNDIPREGRTVSKPTGRGQSGGVAGILARECGTRASS